MKVKTSISLSRETVKAIDRLAGRTRSRSAIIEWAIQELVKRESRRVQDDREIALINARADALDREALGTLEDQIDLHEEQP